LYLVNLLALGALIPLPTTAAEVETSDLLSTWERMRRLVYSRPGLSVQGLSVDGVEGVGGYVGADTGAAHQWIGRAVGGMLINQTTVIVNNILPDIFNILTVNLTIR
jgi:hypothetical protein